MIFLAGEWWTANLFMGMVMLVALGGVTALGWWVVRGEAQNRRHTENAQGSTSAEEHAH